jgi:hypothetical protein
MKALVAGTLPAIVGAALQAASSARGDDLPASTAPVTAATTQAAVTTLPDAQTAPAYRTKFEKGDLLTGYFTALSQRFGVVVIVQPEAANAAAPDALELPDKLETAITTAQQALEPQGMAIDMGSGGDVTILHVTVKNKTAAKTEVSQTQPVGIGTTTHPSPGRLPPPANPPAVRAVGGARGRRG